MQSLLLSVQILYIICNIYGATAVDLNMYLFIYLFLSWIGLLFTCDDLSLNM